MVIGKEEVKKFPEVPGLIKIVHIESGVFFLVNTGNIRSSAMGAITALTRGNYHCKALVEKTRDPETELGFSYTETGGKEQARDLKHRIMKANYGNPSLLNVSDWPMIIGGFKITHLPTGRIHTGYGSNLTQVTRHQFHLLRNNKHSSPAFQALWNEDSNRENYNIEWCVCENVTQASDWVKNVIKQAGDLFLGVVRYGDYEYRGGAYILTHKPSGCFYIGSTSNIASRIANHVYCIERNIHANKKLQEVYNREPTAFDVWKEHTENRKAAFIREQELLDIHFDNPLCCNVSKVAESTALGVADNREIQKAKRMRMLQWHRENPEKAKANTHAMMEARRKGVVWDGVEYPSLRKAWLANGEDWSLIYRRLRDPEDYDVYLLKEPKVRPTE